MSCLARNFTFRIVLSFTICACLLLLPSVSLLKSEASQGQRAARGTPARRDRPEGSWPNLEDIKNESDIRREPAVPIPSTMRSKRNEGKPWDGRRVGDAEHRPLDPGVMEKQTRRAHARKRVLPPQMYEDQFIQNFFSLALVRSATSEETLYWNYLLRAGYNQNQTSLKLAAIELGKTLFESASYAARNRDAHWYVYDLYKTYLMRDPDSGGWSFWEPLVSSHGREYVRRGFEESGEFATLMATIVPSGATGAASSLVVARVDPGNQPGNGMLARDASWSVPLLSLPGRNGLDLGLTLAYSSMVWTRSGPYLYFDEDNGFPSPGFRLGFPSVQRKVFNAQTEKNGYLLITPAGHRVDLRQIATSGVYEAADSSHLQLTESGANLLVRSTDGKQFTFSEANNEYRCVQIKDRNGNYISVNYNTLGQITSITDTLGRLILFNYDGNANLLSITQAWNGQPSHQWVSFGWSTRNMQYSFTDQSVIGIKNGQSVPVITQVALNDSSYFTFDYTNPLQVSAIRKYFAAIERNAITFTYDSPTAEVPRLSSSSVSAQNWTGINGVPTQITTQYSVAGDGACVLVAPDGTTFKEYYGTGWQRGLKILSEVWSGGVKQKWTTTTWTQDNTSVSYELNPRVTETNIYDSGGNRRRTTIEYGSYAQWGLPYGVHEYAADGVTEIRQTWTDYNLSQAFLDRRIIGLVSQVHLTNVSSWQGKISYEYDDPSRLQSLPAAASQHDTSYSTSFTVRGNVTSVSRWDITDITNSAKKLTTYTNYFVTGSPASTTDSATHTNSISYADSFSDSINRNTFAYPTTQTDADNASSYVQYNFDFGATTRTQSPAPAGQSSGAIQTMTYNSLGQLERVTTANNGAYKRFWYGADYIASYATVNNTTDELYSMELVDGMGHVIATAANHPGSSGGYRLVNAIYDQMGRAVKVSNPTEVNNSWIPSGDDAAGIYYTQQTYDWNGRPLFTTNPGDNTTKEVSYNGCGCAGGAVTTYTDEGTVDVGVAKRRQRKVYSDVLGRPIKTELLNWQGGSVYTTIVNTYNGSDQVTFVRQYAGAEGSSNYQDTTITYDGYGRLKTKHLPEHDTGTAITWNYNVDDTLQSVTDARGVTSTYSYNNRHLITGIIHTGGYLTTPNVSFGYDAASNRTAMSDGVGSVIYGYDELSRLTSESRSFAGLNQTYTITSGYNLANQLTSVGTPFTSQQVGYTYDSAGKIDAVTGTGYSDTSYQGFWPNWYPVTTQVNAFLSNISQRATGAVKQMTLGNGGQVNLNYNSRLAPSSFQISNLYGQQSYTANYTYYDDGRLRLATDLTGGMFDRLYTYDQVGRYKEALTGDEARGGGSPDGPYRQTYSYDVWGNITSLTKRVWTLPTTTINSSYTNNRKSVWSYDANGFADSHEDGSLWYNEQYDAATRRTYFEPVIDYPGGLPAVELHYGYDGNSLPTTTTQINRSQDPETGQVTTSTTISYYLRSTVLGGQVVADLSGQGNKTGGYVYLDGMLLASELYSDFPSTHWMIHWKHQDPATGSTTVSAINGTFWGTGQLDPLGNEVSSPPPDPEVFIEPPYANPKQEQFWPVEAAGWDAGRTNEMEIGMAQYVGTMNMIMAREAWRRGERDRAQRILASNPNVGIMATGRGAAELARLVNGKLDSNGGLSIWGAQAAQALGFVYTPQELIPTASIGVTGGDELGGGQQAKTLDEKYQKAPKLKGTPTTAQVDAFNDAYDLFAKRLQERPGCSGFFGSAEDALKSLHKLNISFADLGGPRQIGPNTFVLIGAEIDSKSSKMRINSRGQFMGIGSDMGYHGVAPPLSGAIVLAHEVAHKLGKIPTDGDYGNGNAASEDNTWRVIQACFLDENGTVR